MDIQITILWVFQFTTKILDEFVDKGGATTRMVLEDNKCYFPIFLALFPA